MLRRPSSALLAAAACVVAAAVVRVLAYTPPGHWLDDQVLHGFTGLSTGRAAPLADGIASLCDPTQFTIIALVIIGVALARSRPRLALAVAVVMVAANLTTEQLKPALADPRFAAFLEHESQVRAASWPSGHATAAMTLALCAVMVSGPRLRPLVAAIGGLFAVAVTYAVLALHWHYPSDVLGGFLVAGAWTMCAIAAVLAADRRWPARAGRSMALRAARTARVADVLTPTAVALAAVAAVAAAIVALRPSSTASYVAEHTWFVAGAAAIAVLGIALATGLALALRQEPTGPAAPDGPRPGSASGSGPGPRAAPRPRWPRGRG